MNKPNNQTVIPVSVVPSLMQDLALKQIRNFGGKLGQLLESLGCVTAADVQKLSLQQLEAAVGSNAQYAPTKLSVQQCISTASIVASALCVCWR